jgi:hypothetical protein
VHSGLQKHKQQTHCEPAGAKHPLTNIQLLTCM